MLRKIESMYLPSEMSLEDMKEAVDKFVKENFTDLGYPAQAFISQSRYNSNKYVATVFSSMRKMENNEWVKKKQDNMYIDKDGNRINPVPSPIIAANGKVIREKDTSIPHPDFDCFRIIRKRILDHFRHFFDPIGRDFLESVC